MEPRKKKYTCVYVCVCGVAWRGVARVERSGGRERMDRWTDERTDEGPMFIDCLKKVSNLGSTRKTTTATNERKKSNRDGSRSYISRGKKKRPSPEIYRASQFFSTLPDLFSGLALFRLLFFFALKKEDRKGCAQNGHGSFGMKGMDLKIFDIRH